jgi:hypothetical protein
MVEKWGKNSHLSIFHDVSTIGIKVYGLIWQIWQKKERKKSSYLIFEEKKVRAQMFLICSAIHVILSIFYPDLTQIFLKLTTYLNSIQILSQFFENIWIKSE